MQNSTHRRPIDELAEHLRLMPKLAARDYWQKAWCPCLRRLELVGRDIAEIPHNQGGFRLVIGEAITAYLMSAGPAAIEIVMRPRPHREFSRTLD